MFAALHKLFQAILPRWIHKRLIGDWDQQGFKKYFHNTSWMFLAKIVSVAVSFFTVAIIARYLGPENFGKLSYAQSFVAIFSVFSTLGINQILYRELSAHPEKESEILGTAFLSTLFFGTITLLVTVVSAALLHDDIILTWLVGILALSFIFQPFGILSVFFQSKVQAKYPSIIKIILAFLLPALKLLVIFLDQGILFIAGVILAETLLGTMGLLYVYVKIFHNSLFTWTFSFTNLLALLRDSWPLVLANLSGYVYARIDQVMIQNFLDSSSVAYYDIAARLTDFTCFLPGVIVGSVFPAIVTARKNNPALYRTRFVSLTKLTLGITFISAALLALTGPFIITTLFGDAYNEATTVLNIYAWSSIGIVALLLIQQYFIIENKSKHFLLYSISGATINVILNYFLIQQYGTTGAAVATLATFIAIVVFFILSRWLYTKKDSAL